MATIEDRVESLEIVIASISRQEDHLLQMLEAQQQHLLKHDEHLEKLDRLLERQQRQMESQQQQIASMERLNLQSRRMWISMARKMDWDYEDPELDS